jgi:hypothetical protein
MGLFGGLMGWDAADERLPVAAQALRSAGINRRIEIVDAGDEHPNTYRLTLRNGREERSLIAISTGGGMMEVIAVDGFKVSMFGDSFETLLWVRCNGRRLALELAIQLSADGVLVHQSDGEELVEVKAQAFVGEDMVASLKETFDMLCPGSLYPRVFTEGMVGIVPTGVNSFDCTPWLLKDPPRMALRNVRAFGRAWDLVVERSGAEQKVRMSSVGRRVLQEVGRPERHIR